MYEATVPAPVNFLLNWLTSPGHGRIGPKLCEVIFPNGNVFFESMTLTIREVIFYLFQFQAIILAIPCCQNAMHIRFGSNSYLPARGICRVC